MAEIDRTAREPIELAETRKGTHLMDAVRIPDGFVAPSAAITTVQAQAAATSTVQASPADVGGGPDRQRSE